MKPAFVISPIGKPSSAQRAIADEVLTTFIRPPARKYGFEPCRGDDVSSPGLIIAQICESILRDSLLFAYLKDGNPNVYYELAIAQTLRKPIVLLKDPIDSLPFDVGAVRVITLDRDDIAATRKRIEDQISFLLRPTYTVESPIAISPEQVLASTMPRTANLTEPPLDISGIWSGFTVEAFPGGDDVSTQKYHAEMRINCVGTYVIGTVFIAYGDDYDRPRNNTAIFQLHGSIRHPRFVRLHYDNDRVPEHCGLLFLEIAPGNCEAVGTFAGYGVSSGKPVHGRISMRKAGSDDPEESG